MRKRVGAMGVLLLSAAGWAQAPGVAAEAGGSRPGPMTTLTVRSRVVAISAVVTGKDGGLRGGLTKDDFVLKQDGREEPIHYFSQGSELPLTVALLVDTSGSQRTFIGDEMQASDVFFEAMLGRREDRAALVEFDTNVVQLSGLTPSASALHLALEGLRPHASAVGGTLLNDAVYAVAKGMLAKETGRKAMVILSDGGDNGSRRSLAEAIEQAQRGDVQVYSIVYSAWQGMNRPGSGYGGPAMDPGQGALQKLSESTGGRVFTVSPGLSLREIYARISADLRLQYELGYTPPADLPPNSYHKLELKAKDRKLAVQARKGFFAQP